MAISGGYFVTLRRYRSLRGGGREARGRPRVRVEYIDVGCGGSGGVCGIGVAVAVGMCDGASGGLTSLVKRTSQGASIACKASRAAS